MVGPVIFVLRLACVVGCRSWAGPVGTGCGMLIFSGNRVCFGRHGMGALERELHAIDSVEHLSMFSCFAEFFY